MQSPKAPAVEPARQLNLLFDNIRLEGLGLCGAGQDHIGAGSDPHAGGRPQRRGA